MYALSYNCNVLITLTRLKSHYVSYRKYVGVRRNKQHLLSLLHPPTQWNLRGGDEDEAVLNKGHKK